MPPGSAETVWLPVAAFHPGIRAGQEPHAPIRLTELKLAMVILLTGLEVAAVIPNRRQLGQPHQTRGQRFGRPYEMTGRETGSPAGSARQVLPGELVENIMAMIMTMLMMITITYILLKPLKRCPVQPR